MSSPLAQNNKFYLQKQLKESTSFAIKAALWNVYVLTLLFWLVFKFKRVFGLTEGF